MYAMDWKHYHSNLAKFSVEASFTLLVFPIFNLIPSKIIHFSRTLEAFLRFLELFMGQNHRHRVYALAK